jgi:hypothetical protein
VHRGIGQWVAVEHNNLLEPIGQSPGRGQRGDAGTDNDGCFPDRRGARASQVAPAGELILVACDCAEAEPARLPLDVRSPGNALRL